MINDNNVSLSGTETTVKETKTYKTAFFECDHYGEISMLQMEVFYWDTWFCPECKTNRTVRGLHEVGASA